MPARPEGHLVGSVRPRLGAKHREFSYFVAPLGGLTRRYAACSPAIAMPTLNSTSLTAMTGGPGGGGAVDW